MEGKKGRDWAAILTLTLCVVLLAVNFRQGKRLETLEHQISDARISIMDNIRDMESTVYSQIREADKLVLDWSYTPALDMERRGVALYVTVWLREWREDSTVELVWTYLGETGEEGVIPLASAGKGSFSGRMFLPVLSGEFGLDVVVQNGETQRRESLGGVYDPSEMLPVQCDFQGGRTQTEYLKDVFTVYECGAKLLNWHYQSLPETKDHVFRLRRNGEIAAEQAAEPGDRLDTYFCGKLSTEVRPGDQMALTFFCRDENGLGYEFLLQDWIAVEERDVARGGSEWEDWPKLTWD